jgi:hypothetical protein
MNPIRGAMASETKTEACQSSLEAVHATCRAPVNLIDEALLTVQNRQKPLLASLFQNLKSLGPA